MRLPTIALLMLAAAAGVFTTNLLRTQTLRGGGLTHPPAKEVLVMLTSHKYALWTLDCLASLEATAPGTNTACLVVGDLSNDTRERMHKACGRVIYSPEKKGWPTAHWHKLRMLTDPYFRRFERVRYLDSDHYVREAPDWSKWVATPEKPVGMMCLGCSAKNGRLREFTKELPDYKASDADKRGVCCSTRIMVFEMSHLDDVETMTKTVDDLLLLHPPKTYKYWEQGFLQLLFWDDTTYLGDLGGKIEHFYHLKCRQNKVGQCREESR